MSKIYRGNRSDGALTVTVNSNASTRELNPRFDVRNHSPTGFECGYAGSGPSQLALALCVDALGDTEKALAVYQKFKLAVVAGLPRDLNWELTEEQVLEYIEILTRELE